MIPKSMIHFFEEFRCKLKGKDVCSSSGLVSVAADSMMELKFGMMVGETSFSKPKGKEEKKKTKGNGRVVVLGFSKAKRKSKGKAKRIYAFIVWRMNTR